MTSKKQVLIVDDHPVVRRGLSMLINMEDDMGVCGEAESVITGIEAVKRCNPDIALVDISLKDSDGMHLIRQLKSMNPNLPILAVSMHDETIYAERALRAGAQGYITKQAAEEKIVLAIRHVLSGEIYLSPQAMAKLAFRIVGQADCVSSSPVDLLSDREFEVFRMIGRGQSISQIAEVLHRSVKTVETHQARIKSKLHLKSARDLTGYAVAWMKAHTG